MQLLVRVLLISLVLITSSCKSKKVIRDNYVATPLPIEKVVKNYHQNTFNQQTVKAKIKVDYKDNKSEQSFIANLRMEKDKTIWITATILGIPLVKALITPEKVSYYEKINETYFEGDFSMLSDWLGTPLDFEKVQNMLFGQAINSIDKNNFEVSLEENAHLLKQNTNQDLYSILFWINPQHFRLNKQIAIHPLKKQFLSVVYQKYEIINDDYFPSKILIEVIDVDKSTKIELDFKSVEFNESLSFPFEIPSGYKLIHIN
jgi:hypothetical protein